MTELIITGHNVNIRHPHGKGLVIENGKEVTEIESHSGLTCLLVHRETGVTSAEADHWLKEDNITYIQMWRDRGVITTNVLFGDQELMHKQLAYSGSEIERYLLSAKMEGQADVADKLLRSNKAAKAILRERDKLATSVNLKATEGHGAKAYWEAWKNTVMVPFTVDDFVKVEASWRSFPGRKSPNGKQETNQHAGDPVNAMLNLAYAATEALCIRACHATGLTPVIGISHNRRYSRRREGLQARNSMAYDLMEPLRPYADKIVLSMLDYGQGIKPYLRKRDFFRSKYYGELPDIPNHTCRIANQELIRKIYREIFEYQDLAVEYAHYVRDNL